MTRKREKRMAPTSAAPAFESEPEMPEPAKRGQQVAMWRFGDGPRDPIALDQGRRLFPVSVR